MEKNTICLWYNRNAEEAAHFYAQTFPDSTVGAVHRAPSDFPGGKEGDVPPPWFVSSRTESSSAGLGVKYNYHNSIAAPRVLPPSGVCLR